MLRYYYIVGKNILRLPGMIKRMRELTASEEYSEEERYEYVRWIVSVIQKTGRINTKAYGIENLPKEGGYIMYPNHQGKYDAYGIASVHEKTSAVVMDKEKSLSIFIREVIDVLKGKRLDKQDLRQTFVIMNEIAEEVKQGRRYVIFPEGEYDNNKKNSLIEFKSGCFKPSIKSKTPIVPVVLIDSYKAMNTSDLRSVDTQVHFLKPLYYEDYKDMRTHQIAEYVKESIQKKIDEVTNAATIVS